MNSRLSEFLEDTVGYHKKEMYLEAITAMQRHNEIGAVDEITAMLDHSTDQPTVVLIDAVETIVTIGLDKCLGLYTIVHSGTVYVKTEILNAIRALQNYEDSDTVLNICETMVTPEDTVCDLLALCSHVTSHELHEELVSVSHSLIDRISVTHRSRPEYPSLEVPLNPVQLDKVKRFAVKYPDAFCVAELRTGHIRLGLPVGHLIYTLYNDRLKQFESVSVEQALIEINGLVLMSDDIKPIEISSILHALYTDQNYIAACTNMQPSILKDI